MKKSCAALLVALSMPSSASATADDVAENTRVIRRLYDELFSKERWVQVNMLGLMDQIRAAAASTAKPR
jgi:hypothetical protein